MWFLWALAASFFAAIMAESNRKFQLEPQSLNAWRATFAAIMIGAAFPFMHWPNPLTHKIFYAVGVLDGIVAAVGMIMFLSLAARKTGRVTSMIMPVAAVAAFATWWLLVPSERYSLVDNPVQVMMAIFSLFAICFSMQKIRRNDNSWESFIIILPVGIAFGITDALTKWVLAAGHSLYPLAIAYTFLAICTCAITAWLAAIPKPVGGRTIGFLDRKLLWGGFWCGFWTAGMYLGLTFSLSLAPNPIYPGIVMAMTPIWLYILNQVRQTHDDASPISGLIIILGAVGLWLSSL